MAVETAPEVTQADAPEATTAEADPLESVDWENFLVDGPEDEEPEASQDGETYSVTIDGELIEGLTLEDLQQGFMRQGDYTRKTQEVAAARQQLAPVMQLVQALDEDPKGVLQYLSKTLGVDLSEVTDGEVQEVVEESPLDPLDRRLQAIEQERAIQQARTEIASELDSLQATYGDFDRDVLVQFAVENSLTNLNHAYAAWVGQQHLVTQKEQIEARKKNLVPETGGSTSRDAVSVGPAKGQKVTLKDALRMAVQQVHGD